MDLLVASSGTGQQYLLPPWRAPRLWDYNVAVEVDAQFFYSGVPWDMVGPTACIHVCPNAYVSFPCTDAAMQL